MYIALGKKCRIIFKLTISKLRFITFIELYKW